MASNARQAATSRRVSVPTSIGRWSANPSTVSRYAHTRAARTVQKTTSTQVPPDARRVEHVFESDVTPRGEVVPRGVSELDQRHAADEHQPDRARAAEVDRRGGPRAGAVGGDHGAEAVLVVVDPVPRLQRQRGCVLPALERRRARTARRRAAAGLTRALRAPAAPGGDR